MKQNKAMIIGITGGVGSGKSTALDYVCNNYNCAVIKADDVANELKLKGHECYKKIVVLLGEDILSDNGEIDRNKMAAAIFNNNCLRDKVNDIIHPVVRIKIEEFIENNQYAYDYIFIEAALLVEANYFPILNSLWEIVTPRNERIQRLMLTRGYSLEKCNAIMNSQHSDDYYKNKSDEYASNCRREDYYGYRCFVNVQNDVDSMYIKIDNEIKNINKMGLKND